MAGRSPVTAGSAERLALEALAASRDRGEADRGRAVLLTLAGWTSARIGEAFGVREDTVRLWRCDYADGAAGAGGAGAAPGEERGGVAGGDAATGSAGGGPA